MITRWQSQGCAACLETSRRWRPCRRAGGSRTGGYRQPELPRGGMIQASAVTCACMHDLPPAWHACVPARLAMPLTAMPALPWQEGDEVLFFQSPAKGKKEAGFEPGITALLSVARGVRPGLACLLASAGGGCCARTMMPHGRIAERCCCCATGPFPLLPTCPAPCSNLVNARCCFFSSFALQPYPDPEDDKGRGWLAGERALHVAAGAGWRGVDATAKQQRSGAAALAPP